jgi:hypothetical protein
MVSVLPDEHAAIALPTPPTASARIETVAIFMFVSLRLAECPAPKSGARTIPNEPSLVQLPKQPPCR